MGSPPSIEESESVKLRMKFVYRSRKNGRLAYRFERPGFPKHWFKSDPGTPEFLAEWERLMEGRSLAPVKREIRAGSFGWLVHQYQASAAWANLAPGTKANRQRAYDAVLERAANANAAALTAADLRRWRNNRASAPHAANNMLKAISALYEWAVEMEHVQTNPAREVKRLSARSGGFTPWEVDDVRKFVAKWRPGTREHLALAILLFTACRRSDAVKLGRQHVRDGWLRFNQEKTGGLVEIPVLKPLADAIRDCKEMTFLLTEKGTPFAEASFSNWFRKKAREAGVDGKSAHGVRKGAGGVLAEMGCTPHEIMAVLGHSDERTSSIYTRSANRRVLAESAMQKMAGFKW
jgi:integrase